MIDQIPQEKSLVVDFLVRLKHPFYKRPRSPQVERELQAMQIVAERLDARTVKVIQEQAKAGDEYRVELEGKDLQELRQMMAGALYTTINQAADRIAGVVLPDDDYPETPKQRAEYAQKYREVLRERVLNGDTSYLNPRTLLAIEPYRFSESFFPDDGLIHLYSMGACLLPEHVQHRNKFPKAPTPISKAAEPINYLRGVSAPPRRTPPPPPPVFIEAPKAQEVHAPIAVNDDDRDTRQAQADGVVTEDDRNERGARRLITENWGDIKKLHGPKANAHQVQRFINRLYKDGVEEGKPPTLKTIQNRLLDLRKENKIP